MAIQQLPQNPTGTTQYLLGSKSFPGIGCIDAGDRITIKAITWLNFTVGVSDIVPDATGFMPHIVIRPIYKNTMDPKSFPGQPELDAAFGNCPSPPEIRIDLFNFVAPYACEFSIEGGAPANPGAPASQNTLLISWVWDRPRGKRAGIASRLASLMAAIKGGGPLPDGILPKTQRGTVLQYWLDALTRPVPVDPRGGGWCEYRFTVFNAPGINIVTGLPTRVGRPAGAGWVTTTNTGELLALDNGPGTTPAPFVSAGAQPQPMGPYMFAYSTQGGAASVRPLIFGIAL